jgi:hypothetical protein
MSAEFFTVCERLLSATANGVYQGILVTLIAGLALRLFARTNAATRYAVWFGVLLFVTALIPAHLLLSSQPRLELPAAATVSGSSMREIAVEPPHFATTSDSPDADAAFAAPQVDAPDAGSSDGTVF